MTYARCECPIGAGQCHHMAAVLIWIEKNVSRTDMECAWNKVKPPQSEEIEAKRLSVMAPCTSQGKLIK